MKKEIKLKGTPKDLALKLDDLSVRREEIYQNNPAWYIAGKMGFELENDVNPLYITINAGTETVYATARKIPDNRTIVTLDVNDDVWELVYVSWWILYTELDKENWIEEMPSISTSLKKPQPGMSLEDGIMYYHAMKKAKIHYTLKELAFDIGRSESNVRQRHVGCPICRRGNKKRTK